MNYMKLQLSCLVMVLYIIFVYIRERKAYNIKAREPLFHTLLGMGVVEIIFDALTAYTVNHLETTSDITNRVFHFFFLYALDTIIFLMFLYLLDITRGLPKTLWKRALIALPYTINIIILVAFISELHYIKGVVTNYSMGISAYTCFSMVGAYMIAMILVLLFRHKILGRHKLITISTCMMATIATTAYQIIKPEALITSLTVTFIILGTYLNVENPALAKLLNYNDEMVMGFATLIENRDGSTGSHIKRTKLYVKLLSEQLLSKGLFFEFLTRDYVENLVMAAPMHDIGKIAIPDNILQKPGKLTEKEFEIMKSHTTTGGDIIKKTFGHTGDDEYERIAFEVARYHHEKWNGSGYPDGLTGDSIPLSARIMAVADVFDAVSEKRCYRDALPLDECFSIIESGAGVDFDPVVAKCFLELRPTIVSIKE